MLLFAGSLTLWIGIPVGGLWALSKLTDSSVQHFVIGLLGVPVAMAAFAPALFWLNGLYIRVQWASRLRAGDIDEDEDEIAIRGPLEPMLVASFVVAIVALIVWFFVFAKNPSSQVL